MQYSPISSPSSISISNTGVNKLVISCIGERENEQSSVPNSNGIAGSYSDLLK